VWAKVEHVSGTERENQEMVSATGKYEIKIRYNSNVSEKDRVLFGTRTFEINEINNYQERDIYQVLTCTEVK
jgi:SPP1 family predicted phage head-tail adaptor